MEVLLYVMYMPIRPIYAAIVAICHYIVDESSSLVQCLGGGGVLCAWRVREVSLQIIHKGPLGKHNNQGGRLVPRQ